MINEMATTLQTDLKLENHMKEFATSLKHTHNQVPTPLTTTAAQTKSTTNMKTLQNGTHQTGLAAATATAALTNIDTKNIILNTITGKYYGDSHCFYYSKALFLLLFLNVPSS